MPLLTLLVPLAGVDEGRFADAEWIVLKDKERYDKIFATLQPNAGKLSGAAAKAEMMKSRLPNAVLAKIWKLSDVDRDGMLDDDEWALANHLINLRLEGSLMRYYLHIYIILLDLLHN